MGSVARDIFKAIHEQKWLSVEYHNQKDQVTRYWVGINDLDPVTHRLDCDGLHLATYERRRLTLYLARISASAVVEGSYHRTPPRLLQAIESSERFEELFGDVCNLKILDYLYDCARLNSTPFVEEFSLVRKIDADSFAHGALRLSDEQYAAVIRLLQGSARAHDSHRDYTHRQIGLNVVSVHTRRGLYVLAYRELRLDVSKRVLAIGRGVHFCREFRVRRGQAEEVLSIRRFLDEDEIELLADFESNAERIKDALGSRAGAHELVDDEPHLFLVARNSPTYLTEAYDAIAKMAEGTEAPLPIRAFFGNLCRLPVRRKEYPLSIVSKEANLDQLLAINQALKYPLTYVQGPPGTGKTVTIVNTIVNAFCHGRTVLFASYNNHPVDGVFQTLTTLACGELTIPFPILRLGNRQRVVEALDYMRELYERVKDVPVPRRAPRLGDEEGAERAQALTALLKEYERRVELTERRECVEMLAESNDNLNFTVALETRQLQRIDEELADMRAPGELFDRTRALTASDREALLKFLLGASLWRVQQLGKPRYADLFDIVCSDDAEDERAKRFNDHIADPHNLRALQLVFPIIATTCISARRLGPSATSFDLTILDEASQCDTATALVPILRGRNLMLVGDPQQLSPVVLLDEADNAALRRTYQVTDEYDYVENSVYKTFLAADSVSTEILLHAHYRTDERIIAFNNEKYYAGKLDIRSGRRLPVALEFIDCAHDTTTTKNTAPVEAEAAVDYARRHPELDIGIITPFANQRTLIRRLLAREAITNASCGTVHAFQGDEKNTVLFSLALTDRTAPGTYRWLAENAELINVATSRARDKLVVLSSTRELERLHTTFGEVDDIFELASYVRTRGQTHVTPRKVASRALGVKPYSTETETAFMETLSHALDNIFLAGTTHSVQHEVAIAAVFREDCPDERLFFTGRFDFVVFEEHPGEPPVPVLAIELDGKEHADDEVVRARDERKRAICERHGFELIRVENSYARRYHHIKEILTDYFERA